MDSQLCLILPNYISVSPSRWPGEGKSWLLKEEALLSDVSCFAYYWDYKVPFISWPWNFSTGRFVVLFPFIPFFVSHALQHSQRPIVKHQVVAVKAESGWSQGPKPQSRSPTWQRLSYLNRYLLPPGSMMGHSREERKCISLLHEQHWWSYAW